MSHSRSPFQLAMALGLLLALGCDSGPPPLPPPTPPAPAEKAATSVKKGAKKKPPVDSELDPDSGQRTRRRLLREGQAKPE